MRQNIGNKIVEKTHDASDAIPAVPETPNHSLTGQDTLEIKMVAAS